VRHSFFSPSAGANRSFTSSPPTLDLTYGAVLVPFVFLSFCARLPGSLNLIKKEIALKCLGCPVQDWFSLGLPDFPLTPFLVALLPLSRFDSFVTLQAVLGSWNRLLG